MYASTHTYAIVQIYRSCLEYEQVCVCRLIWLDSFDGCLRILRYGGAFKTELIKREGRTVRVYHARTKLVMFASSSRVSINFYGWRSNAQHHVGKKNNYFIHFHAVIYAWYVWGSLIEYLFLWWRYFPQVCIGMYFTNQFYWEFVKNVSTKSI